MIAPKYRMKELQNKLTIQIGDCDFYLLLAYLSGNEDHFSNLTSDYFVNFPQFYEGYSEYCQEIPLSEYHTIVKLQIDFREPLPSTLLRKVFQFKISSSMKTVTDDEVLYAYSKQGTKLNMVPKQDLKQLRIQFFSKLLDLLDYFSDHLDKTPLVTRFGLDPNDYPLDQEKNLYDLLHEYAQISLEDGQRQEIKEIDPTVIGLKKELLSKYPSRSPRVLTEIDSTWITNRLKG